MKTHTRALIIGGGVVGTSVLYHLTKLGWSDVMLIERSELTSGSTWHAAGGFHTLNGDTIMAALQGYTIRLYRELEELTGVSCGLHHVGGITLADTPERMDMLKAERGKHRYMGLDTHLLTPQEVAQMTDGLVNTDGLVGALFDPLDGHLDPSGTTQAYAKAARMGGAEIVLHNRVLETNPRADGSWEVVTEKGTIIAEHLVNAAGLWAREVAQMAGVYLPAQPMAHQYLVTDEIAEIMRREQEFPHVMDPGGESYLRQEGRGLCIGFYEQPCEAWAVDGTPWEFGHELLPDQFDKIEESVAFAYRRFPVLERAGVKSVIHGPFTFAPDGNPLVGPVPGLRNYWAAAAIMAGFSQAGGMGLSLAQWMIEGAPERDPRAFDVARFGDWTTPGYTLPKVVENYQRRFSVSYPNEELPAARPFRTTPMHDRFTALGAVWGEQYGLEVPNYFARGDEPRFETPSFRRSDAFAATAREVAAVRGAVGINEVHNFGKYRVTGPKARDWLDRIMAGRIPPPGRLSLCPMLSPAGRIVGDLTVTCLEDRGAEEFQLIASYAAQGWHMRWFTDHLEPGVQIENISETRTGFQIAGPQARTLLARCTRADVDNTALGFLRARRMTVGMADCIVQRVSYTGDLGFEIYTDHMSQRHLWDVLWSAGQDLGLTPFGMRAMMSLRLDRFFGAWGREFAPDYTAGETGLDRFIAWKKPAEFIGRAAAEAERAAGTARRLHAFAVDAADADVVGWEPIWLQGAVAGFCTSGGYSHHAGTSVALGFVPREQAHAGLEVEIEILGDRRPARLIETPLVDPEEARLRG